MKTSSQVKRPDIADHSRHRKPARLLSPAILTAAVAILLVKLVDGETTVEPPDFCRQTAQAVLMSCRSAARSDFWLAWGKCDKLTDPAAREDCREQASADLEDARETCDEQNNVRLAACERLGPARYDPVIDPSNFVARIDNPYFPLRPGTTFIYEGHTAQGFEH